MLVSSCGIIISGSSVSGKASLNPMIFSSVTEFPALSFTNKYTVILPAIKLETFD